ncbi:MAG: hypothetical protein PHP44_08850 [Kiritimatiellae bacterium]|nr:hypothetical protein [Kiritimatiellia bacterium]
MKKFPMIGKNGEKVSNGWKSGLKSFQWLEKSVDRAWEAGVYVSINKNSRGTATE